MCSPEDNLARISNLRSAIEAVRLHTFSLEQQLRPFEEWRQDAIFAIEALEIQRSEPTRKRSLDPVNPNPKREPSGSKELPVPFPPPREDPTKRARSPAPLPPVQVRAPPADPPGPTLPPPPPGAVIVTRPVPPMSLIPHILSSMPNIARLQPWEQVQVLMHMHPQFAVQVLQYYKQAYAAAQR
jgi:hypothetical protein